MKTERKSWLRYSVLVGGGWFVSMILYRANSALRVVIRRHRGKRLFFCFVSPRVVISDYR